MDKKLLKKQRLKNRLKLRMAIFHYLETVAPVRRYSTIAQLKAMAKQMEQSNRIPFAVMEALQKAENAVSIQSATAVGTHSSGN